jgi:hypothetical protein
VTAREEIRAAREAAFTAAADSAARNYTDSPAQAVLREAWATTVGAVAADQTARELDAELGRLTTNIVRLSADSVRRRARRRR